MDQKKKEIINLLVSLTMFVSGFVILWSQTYSLTVLGVFLIIWGNNIKNGV